MAHVLRCQILHLPGALSYPRHLSNVEEHFLFMIKVQVEGVG